VKEAKVVLKNKKQLLCSNKLILEIKQETYKICMWSVALYGSETWTLGKNEERVVNAFETWSWRGMLHIKWTDRIMNGEVFQRAKKKDQFLKLKKNRRHSCIGHAVGHNEFVVNSIEGAISGEKGPWEDLDYNT